MQGDSLYSLHNNLQQTLINTIAAVFNIRITEIRYDPASVLVMLYLLIFT